MSRMIHPIGSGRLKVIRYDSEINKMPSDRISFFSHTPSERASDDLRVGGFFLPVPFLDSHVVILR